MNEEPMMQWTSIRVGAARDSLGWRPYLAVVRSTA